MLAHLVRQLLGGVVTLLLATFTVSTLLFYILTLLDVPSMRTPPPETHPTRAEIIAFELDKPWPINLLAYLFDPGETTELIDNQVRAKGVDTMIFGIEVKGSGLLTGDFGRSIIIAKGKSALDFYGPGLRTLLATLLALIVTFAYVAVVQRMGSPTPYQSDASRLATIATNRCLQPVTYRHGV